MTPRLHLSDAGWPRGIEPGARSILDALPSIVFVTDAAGATVYVNAEYERYTGRSAEALLGHGWASLVHPEDRAPTEAAWAGALRAGTPVEVEYRLRGADGTHRWFKGRVAPQRDAAGGPVLRWVGTCTDIHELKTAEAQSREAEAWLRLAQEASGAGTFAWTPATDEMRWSAECKAIFGLPPDAAMTDGLFMSRVHPDDREAVRAAVARAFDPAGDGRYALDYRALRPDGTVRWVDARGRVLPGPDGGPRFIGTVLDVTEARRTAEALALALEGKEALLYEVNHRVKNNLQMVTGLLAMQAARSHNAETRRHLREAQSRIGVMSAIHQSLYSLDTHGEVDMVPFLRRLAGDTVAAQGEGRIALTVAGEGEAVMPLRRALPLALIVSELLTNALKYAFAAGAAGTIRLRVEPRGGTLRVEVADDGAGLPEGFEPRRSTGLGMRIIAALAAQVGGEVAVLPATRGAAFAVEVPLGAGD
ncbi:sensor histidine kinase [Rubellimicrobium aerolatum]|uniref:histidine kinase n=1 Tax=Rubellimicrobium aerolatum TaxID=490979 RepID=A0ABW0SHJ5_9RHOB|nr:PAS domain-containing protein [Rubellimicrobium aerolatum]MBP1807477.1 PAS domain S-box-containing protein [Rubellimicrobium aerolatum]